MAKSKTRNKYITENYTLTYFVRKIQNKPYAIISGIENIHSGNLELIIPSKIQNLDVYSIDKNAFADTNEIKSVIIQEGVQIIDSGAFANCSKLQSITIPSSVKEIDSMAFYLCGDLKTVNFSEGLEKIGVVAFECSGLEDITLPDSLKIIDRAAFRESKIRSLHIGPNVKYICDSAFSDCKYLTDVTFSKGITEIHDYVFRNCDNLKSIRLPDSLFTLGYGVFDCCYSIKSIHIGSELREFESCKDFAYRCDSLEKITVSPSNSAFKSINNILFDVADKVLVRVPPAINDKNIVIPSWVHRLADCCFAGVNVDKLIVKTKHDIGDISCIDFDGAKEVYCIPNSPAEKYFNTYEYSIYQYKVVPLVSEIDSFLNSISDNLEK